MRTFDLDELRIDAPFYEEADRLMVDLLPLLKDFPLATTEDICAENAKDSLIRQLPAIIWATSFLPKGKVILDLGCGSNTKALELSIYPPWLCRALHLLGAKPIGVDFGRLEGESFEHYQVELSQQRCLSQIPSQSVDLAYSCGLFGSPTLLRLRKDYRTLKRNVFDEVERVLKPGAVFIYRE